MSKDNTLYFLNDLYNDTVISDMIGEFRNRLFNDILVGKDNIQNSTITNGDVYDLDQDSNINLRYGMPEDSYRLHLNCNILPFYSENQFLKKYEYGTPISFDEIMQNNAIFSRALYFFIGDTFIRDIKIVIERQESIIFIPSSNLLKIEDIEDLISESNVWSIMLIQKTDYYEAYMSRTSLIDGNKIYVSKLSVGKTFNSPNKNNSWTAYLTNSVSSPNLMSATNVVMQHDDYGEYFELSDEFKAYIYNFTGSIKCLIVNNPNCSGNGIYINSDEVSPIFHIPYKENPISIRNLKVWKYDSTTKRKLHPFEPLVIITHPNIYDFSNMYTVEYFIKLFEKSKSLVVSSNKEIIITRDEVESETFDLYIEWDEPTEDISNFDYYYKDYVECKGERFLQLREENALPKDIQKYSPLPFMEYTPAEYMKSAEFGDYRAWRIVKIKELLNDNPKQYEQIFNRLFIKNRKFVSKTYTITDSEHIYSRSIMDNKLHCGEDSELYVIFNEPQSYIDVYNASCRNTPCSIYFNGIRKPYTYKMNFGSRLYVYFPVSYIQNNEDIHIDIEIDSHDIEKGSIQISSTESESMIESNQRLSNNSTSNLILFDIKTNKIIQIEKFDLQLMVDKLQLKFNGVDRDNSITFKCEEVYLYDSDVLLFVPDGFDRFVLYSRIKENVKVDSGRYEKKIDLSDLTFSTTDESLCGDTVIGVASTNFYKVYTTLVTQEYLATNGHEFKITNFMGSHSIYSMFHVFYNGKLVSPEDFTTTMADGYGATVKIDIPSITESGRVDIEYLGYDERLVYSGLLRDIMENDIVYLKDYLKTPFSNINTKIFIDGYRVGENCIIQLGQSDMLMFEGLPHDITEDSKIVIYQQKYDDDPFGFKNSNRYLADITKDDEEFRTFMKEKYI